MKQQFAFQPPAAELFNPMLLTKEDVDACLTVHSIAQAKLLSLKTPQPHFLKPVTKEDMIKLVLGGGKILGVKDESAQLVAKNHLSFPKEPIPKEVQKDFPSVDLDKVARLGAFSCIKEGVGVASLLLDFNKQVAVAENCKAVVAKVAKANEASLHTFAKADFKIVAEGIDTKRDCINEDYEFVCFSWANPAFRIG